MPLVSTYIPLENISKPEVFSCFQEVEKYTSGIKWVHKKPTRTPLKHINA